VSKTKSNRFHTGMIKIFLIGALIIINSHSGFSQNPRIDSLTKVLAATSDDTVKIDVMSSLITEYQYNDPVKSREYAYRALAILKNFPPSYGYRVGDFYREIGMSHWILAEYNTALQHLRKAQDIYQALSENEGEKKTDFYKKKLSQLYEDFGLIYGAQGDYARALDYHFKGFYICEELKDIKGLATAANNIGVAYDDQGNAEKARDYFEKSAEYCRKSGDMRGLALAYNNIGLRYSAKGDYKKAKDYYNKSLEIRLEMDDKLGIAYYYISMGMLCSDMLELSIDLPADSIRQIQDDALKYYGEGKKLTWELSHKRAHIYTLWGIGSILMMRNQIKKTLELYHRAAEIAEEIESLMEQKDAYKALGEAYIYVNDHRNAYEYFRRYTELKDTLFNEEKSKTIGRLEARHEFGMAELKRRQEEEKRARSEAAAKVRRDNLQYSGILIFLVTLGGSLLTLGRFKMPIRLAEGLVFFTFLLFFEFTLVLLDPYIEQYSSGAPAIKLAFNAVLAACIFPLHSFFESKLKSRLEKHK